MIGYTSFLNTSFSFSDEIISVESKGNFQEIFTSQGTNPFFTKVYFKLNPPEQLQVGKYQLNGEYSIESFLQAFQSPLNEDQQITILEWWNIYDIDKELTEKWLITAGDFVVAATSSNLSPYHFLEGLASLEWYLYPDTYNVNPNNFSTETFINKMLQNFDTKVYKPYFSHADNETIFELITLASIVQKEASFGDNKTEIATIAGILKKRLNEWWQIGADATVCYAHKIATQDCSPTEVLQYLYDVNDYNTRAMVGLSAWPIANPEAHVIEATLNSIDSPYYFYLHDNSGQIYYGRTNAEHERNKALHLN